VGSSKWLLKLLRRLKICQLQHSRSLKSDAHKAAKPLISPVVHELLSLTLSLQIFRSRSSTLHTTQMFTGSIARTLRTSTVCRSFSSLRSTRGGPAARRTVGRRPPPSGIPVNATKASQQLLEKLESSSQTHNAPESQYNSLLTPVHIPEDPGAVIKSTHPAARLLENSALVVQRNLELGNIILYGSNALLSNVRSDSY
jgi:hypothetical protein